VTERLSKRQRQERILNHLGSEVSVRINSLAGQFGVTTETIRRDIDELTRIGLVNRTYGGAVSNSLTSEPSIRQRQRDNIAERKRVARYAASLIEPGDVLMIDSGSTTSYFAKALADRMIRITILSNCIPVVQGFGDIPEVKVIMCPGDYRHSENGVYGHQTTSYLEHFQANKAIIGAGGISENSVTDVDPEASWVKRKMMAQSETTMLLLDHDKFGKCMFDKVCTLEDIDDLIVDSKPPDKISRALGAASVKLHIAR
jgi:DeoR/GlpR family transcriptional regulator of sugar metabolism